MKAKSIAIVTSEYSFSSGARVETFLRLMHGEDCVQSFDSISNFLHHFKNRKFGVVVWQFSKNYANEYEREIEYVSQRTPILCVCHGSNQLIPKMLLKNGVKGLMRYESSNHLADAVKKLREGHFFVCSIMLKTLIGDIRNTSSQAILSNREMEILKMLSKGNTYMEISDYLFISFDTTKSHVYNIYKKLSARNKTEAVYKAREKRILI